MDPQAVQIFPPTPRFQKIARGAREFFGPLWTSPPALLACCLVCATVIAARYHGQASDFRTLFSGVSRGTPLLDTLPYLYWFGAAVLFYLLIPLLGAKLTPGITVRETGFQLGDWRFGLRTVLTAYLIFLPALLISSRTATFGDHYPLCSAVRKDVGVFILYELGFALYFIAWEYLFRGYLLFSLKPKLGAFAIVVQMIPFAILHFGKPELETYGSILAGLFLGLLAWRTRSFLYGTILHIAVSWTMDLLTAVPSLAHLKS